MAPLAASDESYRTMFQQASDAMWVHDMDTGAMIDLNEAAVECFGYSAEEQKAIGVEGLLVPESGCTMDRAWEYARRAIAGEPQRFEWCGRRRDGTVVWHEVRQRRVTIDGVDRLLVTGRDIGDRRAAEAALRESHEELERRVAERTAELAATNAALAQEVAERREAERALARREESFRRLIENASDMVLICDVSGAITYVGPSVERVLGFTPEEMLGLRPSDNMHPDDAPHVAAAIRHLAAHPGEVTTTRYRTLHKDGSWRAHETVARTLSPTSGAEGIVANCRDITDRLAAERALRERDMHFRRMIEHASDHVMIVDATAAITYVAPSVERMLGWTQAEMIGTRPSDLVHPDDVPQVMRDLAWIVAHPGEPYQSTFRIRRKDGNYRVFESLGRTMSPYGVDEGILAFGRDITERRVADEALQRSEEHFRRLIENGSDIILVSDADGRLTYVSPSMRRIMGYDPESLLGAMPADVVHPDDAAEVLASVRRLCAAPGTTELLTYRARHADGSWRIIESSSRTLLPNTAAAGIVGNARDITDQRAAESALRRATAEAEQAREDAERANRAKSDFLSRMSHELRTPMNSILGFGQLLARAELPPQQSKSVAHILKAGRHLLHLINEVLEIARIEAGREHFSLEPVSLASAMQEAYGLVRPLAQQWRVELYEECWPRDAFVHADRQRLVQVLLNLLSNAIKYNRPGGHVRLWCGPVAEPGGAERWAVHVEDGGRGIPADRVEQLFTPFARLGAEQTEIEGTGLGLAVSRRLCEAMGGALALAATSEAGSTFRVELAAAADPRRALEDTGAVAVVAAPHREATLLYVEDNLANLSLVETILLSRPGWRAIPALRGRRGVELARECRPDVVLLDLHLPDMPGDEVLRHLRADPATSAIPVVVVSADATTASVDRLRAAGADAYLTKPLDVDEFLRAVERFLPSSASA